MTTVKRLVRWASRLVVATLIVVPWLALFKLAGYDMPFGATLVFSCVVLAALDGMSMRE